MRSRAYFAAVPRLSAAIAFLAVAASPARAPADRPERPQSLYAMLSRGPGVSNHPIHVVPSAEIRIPDGWPLDQDGSLTCLTCHQGLPIQSESHSPNLRGAEVAGSDSGAFCLNCHDRGSRRSATSMHWLAVRRAHVATDHGSRDLGGLLDADSARCLGCHDGVTAVESGNTTPWNRGSGDLGDSRRNHPVGVRYSDRKAGRSSGALRMTSQLPEEIRLPNGKVSCVSCHNLYGGQRNLLTVPIENSQLCFSCHDMD